MSHAPLLAAARGPCDQSGRQDHVTQWRLLIGTHPGQQQARRKSPEEMGPIVEDLIRLLDGIGEAYRHGRHPDARTAKPAAKLLRALAAELEL